MNDLNGFEYMGIQKKFGQPFEKLSGAERAMGVYWALVNRKESTPWSVVEKIPMYELVGYFQPEDEADPKE
ncbi:hypothetical protein ACTOB_003043 [Actinoplanes oblitus]|uniref:Uncharacterized protein n=1 Tax=Actinoplanes oblitus TaxID=3040509 RepID=A0ABY8WPP0_9ACTN|nr:hypothetical protein [Actinoplanes oblitus]WIM99392.1 hypothetical protein ACTOB_003043 [Actinoplanes oblitus]